jgi:2'-5' RNA ligase
MSVPKASKLELSGLASFGPRKRPRVIWTGFEEKGFFGYLKEDLDHVLDSCGIPMEDQPFRAHLTLGRIRSLKEPGNFYDVLQEMNRDFTGTVLFDRMVFFRSILGPGGPEYHVLEELRF